MRSLIAFNPSQFAIVSVLAAPFASEQLVLAKREPAPAEDFSCLDAESSTWSCVQSAQEERACVYCVHPISVGDAYCSMVVQGEPRPLYAHYSCTED